MGKSSRQSKEKGQMVAKSKERLTLTIKETAQLLGVSRNLAYERAKSGEICPGLRVIKVGRRLLVSKKALEELLQESQQ